MASIIEQDDFDLDRFDDLSWCVGGGAEGFLASESVCDSDISETDDESEYCDESVGGSGRASRAASSEDASYARFLLCLRNDDDEKDKSAELERQVKSLKEAAASANQSNGEAVHGLVREVKGLRESLDQANDHIEKLRAEEKVTSEKMITLQSKVKAASERESNLPRDAKEWNKQCQGLRFKLAKKGKEWKKTCQKLKEEIRNLNHRCWTYQNDERKMRALMKNECGRHTQELPVSGGSTNMRSYTTSAAMNMLLEDAMKMVDDDVSVETVVTSDCVDHSTVVAVAETPPSIVDPDASEELEAASPSFDLDLFDEGSPCFEMEGEICPSSEDGPQGLLSMEKLDNILYHPLRLVALLTVLSHEPKKRSVETLLSPPPQDHERCDAVPEMEAVPEMGEVPAMKGNHDLPDMTQSDSLMSISSNYSMSTTGSSRLHAHAPTKKTWSPTSQTNAAWSLSRAPTKKTVSGFRRSTGSSMWSGSSQDSAGWSITE